MATKGEAQAQAGKESGEGEHAMGDAAAQGGESEERGEDSEGPGEEAREGYVQLCCERDSERGGSDNDHESGEDEWERDAHLQGDAVGTTALATNTPPDSPPDAPSVSSPFEDLCRSALDALDSEYNAVVSQRSIEQAARELEAVLKRARSLGSAEPAKRAAGPAPPAPAPAQPAPQPLTMEQIERIRSTVGGLRIATPEWATGLESAEELVAKLAEMNQAKPPRRPAASAVSRASEPRDQDRASV
jgi:hypothetical protein